MIGLATDRWQLESVHEVTEDVNQAGRLHGAAKPPWSQGDVYAITVLDKEGAQYLLASFHGDTNGLLTVPFMRALLKARKEGGAGWPKRRASLHHCAHHCVPHGAPTVHSCTPPLVHLFGACLRYCPQAAC